MAKIKRSPLTKHCTDVNVIMLVITQAMGIREIKGMKLVGGPGWVGWGGDETV